MDCGGSSTIPATFAKPSRGVSSRTLSSLSRCLLCCCPCRYEKTIEEHKTTSVIEPVTGSYDTIIYANVAKTAAMLNPNNASNTKRPYWVGFFIGTCTLVIHLPFGHLSELSHVTVDNRFRAIPAFQDVYKVQQSHRDGELRHITQIDIPCMSPRNYADCSSDCVSGSQPVMATSNRASSRCLMATAFPDRSHESLHCDESTSLHVTPKPCRLHRHPDHHFRSLLAQFGLTPKSKRGLVAREWCDVWLGAGTGRGS